MVQLFCGKVFRHQGAIGSKPLSTLSLSLVQGITNRPRSADLRGQLGAWMWSKSDKYTGA